MRTLSGVDVVVIVAVCAAWDVMADVPAGMDGLLQRIGVVLPLALLGLIWTRRMAGAIAEAKG